MEKLHTVQEIYKDPESFLNRNIQIGGWVRSNRSSRNFGFLTVQDGSCFQTLQAVYGNHMENFQEISRLNVDPRLLSGDGWCPPRRPGSRLRSRRRPWRWRERPPRIIPCRKNAILWNICGRSPICGPGPILFRRCSASAPWRPTPFTAFSRIRGLSMCIRR